MSVSPAGDLAASMQQQMPTIPPLQVPGIPQMPAPPSGQGTPTTSGNCCPAGTWTSFVAPSGTRVCLPSGAECIDAGSGSGSGSTVCSIPLIGKYACDLGQRIGFTVLAILLIGIGVYVLLGGGLTVIAPEVKPITADFSKALTRKKAVAS